MDSIRLRVELQVVQGALPALAVRPLVNSLDLVGQLDMSHCEVEELLRSGLGSGAYMVFNCGCGIPECGGWSPVRVEHTDSSVAWRFEFDTVYRFEFHRAAYLEELAKLESVLARRSAFPLWTAEREARRSPLAWAIRNRFVDIALEQIESGLGVESRDRDQRTPLHEAVVTSSPELLAALILAGAHLDAADSDGLTPLHLAADDANEPIVAALCRAGASPHHASKTGQTSLHRAARSNSVPTILRLLEFGASITATDSRGWTPLDWARYENAGEAVRELEGLGGVASV